MTNVLCSGSKVYPEWEHIKCENCGGALRFKSTNPRHYIGGYVCVDCGHEQDEADKYDGVSPNPLMGWTFPMKRMKKND